MRRTTWTDRLAPGLLVGAAVGLLTLPLWPDGPQTGNRKLEDAVEQLRADVARADDRARGAEARLTNLEAGVDDLRRKVSRIEPEESVWLNLDRGTGHKWVFDSGEEATVEFLQLTEDTTGASFRVKHKTLDTTVTLRPGETLEVADDRGTERRMYRTTLHAIRRDRSGRARSGLVSLAMSVEAGH